MSGRNEKKTRGWRRRPKRRNTGKNSVAPTIGEDLDMEASHDNMIKPVPTLVPYVVFDVPPPALHATNLPAKPLEQQPTSSANSPGRPGSPTTADVCASVPPPFLSTPTVLPTVLGHRSTNQMASVDMSGGHTDRTFHCSFAPQLIENYNKLATASQDGSACIWEIVRVADDRYSENRSKIDKCIADSPDRFSEIGDCVWCKTPDNDHGEVYRVRLQQRLHGHHDECLRLAWGVGVANNFLATAGASGNVILWDIKTAQQVGVFFQGEKQQVYTCEFFPDDGSALLAGHEDLLSMWDVERGLVVGRWQFHSKSQGRKRSVTDTALAKRNSGETCYVYGAGACNQSMSVAVALSDGSIRVIDPRCGDTVLSFQAHIDDHASNVSFSPGGMELVSTGGKGAVKVWDVRSCGKEKYLFNGHEGPAYGARFNGKTSSGCDSFYSWGADGSVRSWYVSNVGTGVSEYDTAPRMPSSEYPALWFDTSDDMTLGAICGGPSGGSGPAFRLVSLQRTGISEENQARATWGGAGENVGRYRHARLIQHCDDVSAFAEENLDLD
jgi:WD40 repeat protein